MNLVAHVEIPVSDLERAMAFYASVFQVTFGDIISLHGHRMAYFPFTEGQDGASAALAEGDPYIPSHDGAVVYFTVERIGAAIQRAEAAGSRILFPMTAAGNGIVVAEIEDSEGNRIALQQLPG